MDRDASLRTDVRKLLDWEDAHVSFDTAVEGIAPTLRGAVPQGMPHSWWQLLEHLRRTQDQIHVAQIVVARRAVAIWSRS